MLVLIYDDFRRDNEATVRRVLRFLEVDDTVAISQSEANPTVAVRSLVVDDLLRSLYASRHPCARALRATAQALTPTRLRRNSLQMLRRHLVYAAPAGPDEQLTAELRRRYKPEVVGLSEYIDRDLVSLWGYDDVG